MYLEVFIRATKKIRQGVFYRDLDQLPAMIQHAHTARVTRHREQKIPIGSQDNGHAREENGSPDKKCNEVFKTRDRIDVWLGAWK